MYSASEARWYQLYIDQYELHTSNNGVRGAALGVLSSISSSDRGQRHTKGTKLDKFQAERYSGSDHSCCLNPGEQSPSVYLLGMGHFPINLWAHQEVQDSPEQADQSNVPRSRAFPQF